MIKKCFGCGIKLQDSDKEKAGYVMDITNHHLCMRCFKLQNYHELSKLDTKYTNEDIINYVNKKADKVLYLVDFININEETMNSFKEIGVPKTLVISKLDCIPKDFYMINIINKIKKIYDINDCVVTFSAKKKIKLNAILNILRHKETYIMGYTNSGKSSLIASILPKYKAICSNMVNTTLDYIKIVDEDFTIFDTPGLQYRTSFASDLKTAGELAMSDLINPHTYQLKAHCGLEIDDIVIFNESDLVTNITIYDNNLFKIKKIYKELEDEKFEHYSLSNQDLVIKGYGFLHVKDNRKIKIKIKKKELIEVRESIFGE